MRKYWNKYYIEMAYHVATMCTCAAGRKVGAVFVKDNRVLTTGFNGVSTNLPHPLVCIRKERNITSGQSLELCGCVHAEVNGIVNAAREGISLKGSTLYCTTEPCSLCMGALANTDISTIYYVEDYNHNISKDIANYANIKVIKYKE